MRIESRAVKKLLLLGVGSALMFTMGGVGPAQADAGPHIGNAQGLGQTGVVIASVGADRCAACHRAHTAKAGFLLVQAQPQLCYSCHASGGMGSSTDVKNGVDADVKGSALRGGGFDNANINSGGAKKDMGLVAKSYGIPSINQSIPVLLIPPVATTSRHNINGGIGDAGTAWGNGPLNGNFANGDSVTGKTLTLECGSCHDPHGNKNYRILRPMPVDSQWKNGIVDNPGTVVDESLSPATNVNIPDATSKGYTTVDYWKTGDSSVRLNTPAEILAGNPDFSANYGLGTLTAAPDGYIQNIAAWCTTCHTRYLATTKSYKTSSGDATFMYKHRSDANSAQGAANCITCHVSHGSNASVEGGYSSVVKLPDGSLSPTVVGSTKADSKLLRVDNRGTCLMCHNV